MADRYWVGGTGTWTSSSAIAGANWATTSGGTGSAANIPTSADDVFFDANSGSGTVSIDTFAPRAAVCKNLVFTGYTGTFSTTSGVGSSQTYIAIHGNLTLVAGMTFSGTKGVLRFAGAGTQVFTTAGKTIACGIEVTGGGVLQLGDNFTSSHTNPGTSSHYAEMALKVTSGSVDANSKNMTFTGASVYIDGALTTNLVNLTLTSGNTNVWLGGNITCSGTFLANGSSITSRKIIRAYRGGTTITISAATVGACTHLDLQDITGAGAGSWDLSAITGGSGDCGGNSGITFTAAQDHYWVGGTGNWSSTGEWATSSGGASGARVPLPQDNVFFDSNSFSATGQTVTADMARLGKNMNWTGATNSPTLTFSGFSCESLGSVTLIAGMTLNQAGAAWVWGTRTSFTPSLAGQSLGAIVINMGGATLTLGAAFVASSIYLASGTFTTANYAVTGAMSTGIGFNYITSILPSDNKDNGATKAFNFGSSTINWGGGISPFTADSATGFTLSAGTSTINVSGRLKCFTNCTFYDVNFTTDSSSPSASRFLGGIFTVGHNFTITGGYTGTTPVADILFWQVSGVGTTITVSGALTINGSAQQTPLYVLAVPQDVYSGQSFHLICNGTISVSNVNFGQMLVGGTAAPITGTNIGWGGACTGITFSTPRTLYWIGNGGNFQDSAHWSLQSGGTSASTYPLPQDLCIFDQNSFTTTGQTVEMNVYQIPGMRWTYGTYAPTLKFDDNTGGYADYSWPIWFGDEYTFHSNMTIGDGNFSANVNLAQPYGGTTTVTFNGKEFPQYAYWEVNDGQYYGTGHNGRVVFADSFGDATMTHYGDGGTSYTVPLGVTITFNELDWDLDGDWNYTLSHVVHGTFHCKGANGGFFEYQASSGTTSTVSYAATTTGKILFDTDNGSAYGFDFFSDTHADIFKPTVYLSGSSATTLDINSDSHIARVEKQPNKQHTLRVEDAGSSAGAIIDDLIWDGKSGTLSTITSRTGTAAATLTINQTKRVSYCTVSYLTISGALTAENCTNGGNNTGVTFVNYLGKVTGT